MTNATKAQIVALVNVLLALVVAFGFELTEAQTVAIEGAANGVLSVWIAVTYKGSPKRVPDPEPAG